MNDKKRCKSWSQYDLEVLTSLRRGPRGREFCCETKDGLKLIKEFAGSRAKLSPGAAACLGTLYGTGRSAPVDRVQVSAGGRAHYHRRLRDATYVVKDLAAGRGAECDPKNEGGSCLRRMRLLARVRSPGTFGRSALRKGRSAAGDSWARIVNRRVEKHNLGNEADPGFYPGRGRNKG